MPSSTKSKNKFGREIIFEENTHSYYIDDPNGRIDFTSVTTFISKFFPKFDAEKIAPFTAKKLGLTTKEVLDKWEKNAKDARDFGTMVHACCEDTLLNRKFRFVQTTEKEKRTCENAVKAATIVKRAFDIVGIEKLVFDEQLKLSGTIDLLVKSKTSDLDYCIIDWKTNKEITTFSKYHEYAFPPISKLQDCDLSHYGLQLTTYGHILKSGGYVPMAISGYLQLEIKKGTCTVLIAMVVRF